MTLWCPKCSARHVDVGEFATKPHHTHACQECGLTWRPAVVCTVGVTFLPGFKNADPIGPPYDCPGSPGTHEAGEDAETLADRLDAECRAHEQTRQALVQAQADNAARLAQLEDLVNTVALFNHAEACEVEDEYDTDEVEGCRCALRHLPAARAALAEQHPGTALLERSRKVETTARAVLQVCDTPTRFDQQPVRLQEMSFALGQLRAEIGVGSQVQPAGTTVPAEAVTSTQSAEMFGLAEGSR